MSSATPWRRSTTDGSNPTSTPRRVGQPVRRVGKYHVLSELGRGGMATVYLAVARGPSGVNKLVVLKALHAELAEDPEALSMFLDEARLAAQLNHSNVVQTYEVGSEADRQVIVMEYLEGQSYSSILKKATSIGEPLSMEVQLRVMISVLEGLHYAHELAAYDGTPLSLVHRDVSPQNVFVTYDGQVKILDFGIAKVSSSSSHTATGVIKGKIAYMAPEQIVGDPVDRRADVFAIGCMLWAVAAGSKLWKGVSDVTIMRRVIQNDIPTPESVNPNVDPEFSAIVMRALSAEADNRYPSALALQSEVESYVEKFGSAAKPRDIGRMVSKLFAETRTELKALTERQLAVLAAEEAGTSPDAEVSGDSELPVTDAPESRANVEVDYAPRHSEKAKRRPVVPVLAGIAVVLAVALFVLRGRVEAPAKGDAPKVPETAAPAVATPTVVTIAFKASPLGATLTLDGEAIANPSSKQLAKDGRPHKVEAKLEGHVTQSSEFLTTQDQELALVLAPFEEPGGRPAHKPQAASPSPKVVTPKAVATPTPAPQKTADPVNACSNPFYIDSAGIKHVRAECR